jgi:hypothetical protein
MTHQKKTMIFAGLEVVGTILVGAASSRARLDTCLLRLANL